MMDTLPVEILSNIFEECTKADSGLGSSPRILAVVNRRWYQTALRTPALWGTILVTDDIDNYWELQRVRLVYQGWTDNTSATEHSVIQICLNWLQLACTLQRTGATALDITLRFKTESNYSLCSDFYKNIFNNRVTSHIVNLVLECRAFGMIDRTLLNYISANNCVFTRLTRLEVIDVATSFQLPPNSKSVLQLILEQAPNLAQLAVSGYQQTAECLKVDIWRKLSYRATMENLKQLSIYEGDVINDIYGTEVHVRELVIQGAAYIEGSEYQDVWKQVAAPWPRPSTPQTTFLHLIKLHLILDDLYYMSHLSLPLLESLRIKQSSIDRRMGISGTPSVIPYFITDFPKLRSLRVTSSCFAPLIHFCTPQLETLHLTSTLTLRAKADADVMELFPSADSTAQGAGAWSGAFATCLASIVKLHIDANISDKYFIQALRLLPSLQELTIAPGKQLGLVLAKGLAVDAKGKTPTSVLCPKLRIVKLDLCSFIERNKAGWKGRRVGTTTSRGLPAALEKLVKSRKQGGGQALERFSVIEKDGENQEYV